MVKRPALLRLVEKAWLRAVWRWQRASATGPLQGTATAFSQWFGSSLVLRLRSGGDY